MQYATGWVLCQVGRALFEMVDFPQAAKAFEWARQVDQYRLEVRYRSEAPVMVRVGLHLADARCMAPNLAVPAAERQLLRL